MTKKTITELKTENSDNFKFGENPKDDIKFLIELNNDFERVIKKLAVAIEWKRNETK
jgi:hypothetical protein